MPTQISIEDTVAGIVAGQRAPLAKAITLTESRRPQDRRVATELLDAVLPHTGGARRIGISGTPGVGKSTFIEALGLHLVEQGERVAVLAVDPSSKRTGGSILGDRTRMTELSRNPDVFIRSTPSGGTLGGVAEQSGETILLCEAAGFSVVLVETVGVGQSETTVGDLTDLFLLLVAPSGGDELQGIKRGVMEMADVIAINKADGEMANAAAITASDYRSALSLVRPKWPDHPTEVVTCSALEHQGIAELWSAIDTRWRDIGASGELGALRADQQASAFWRHVTNGIVAGIGRSQGLSMSGDDPLELAVRDGRRSPTAAAFEVVERVLGPAEGQE